MKQLLTILFIPAFVIFADGQHSVARKWNEILLEAIRNDFARPTVHARNLYHTSIALYDSWAVYDETAETYFLGREVDGYICNFDGIPVPDDITGAREEAMSFAVYRLMKHRFALSPGGQAILMKFDSLMNSLGFNINFNSTDYSDGAPAALGNYLAEKIIEFGYQDGSNEINDYANRYYDPVNPPLIPDYEGNPDMVHPNRWQPLALQVYIDQSGNEIPGNTTKFLGAEWGEVTPFALSETNMVLYERDGYDYRVYYDPGAPPHLNLDNPGMTSEYMWGFSLVAIWSSHLRAEDTIMWDISPASMGNLTGFPSQFSDYREFYNLEQGGDPGTGHTENPVTGQPYEPLWVPRGDFCRTIAEFWADGPDSETPPGHWFTILNYVNDHPLLEKRFMGEGPVVDDLEWDVKCYLALGGAVHDAAIASWGIKGWYDYVRPVSAIRYMAEQGQSTDPDLPSYSAEGIPLVNGLIELVDESGQLAGPEKENVGKVKLMAWRGHDYIDDPETDAAGVGWILAENWWPYQRPTFVTPPFAGYVSGHSTFSRAAAEVLTLLTGNEYFPGGMGEYSIKKNDFLVFEEGPSMDFTLQWATYRDASDQTSLSRIWGGIHPPADDLPGRIIGEKIGKQAFEKAERLFSGILTSLDLPGMANESEMKVSIFPNPVKRDGMLTIKTAGKINLENIRLVNVKGQSEAITGTLGTSGKTIRLKLAVYEPGLHALIIQTKGEILTKKLWIE